MVLDEDIIFAVRDLLDNDKGNLNFSPASRYAVQKLIDYAREEHCARTVLSTQLDVQRENNAFLRQQSERKEDEKVTEMDQTIVWCHDCKNFLEYTKEYTQTVDGANGDCYIRLVSGADKQFCACKYDDFCSYGKRKDGVITKRRCHIDMSDCSLCRLQKQNWWLRLPNTPAMRGLRS